MKPKSSEKNPSEEVRLVTAALPYINNIPHLGHIVGSHLPADIFARYCRLRGFDVQFVGGTDENGSTSEIAAAQIKVPINEYAERLHYEHKKIYEWFGISYDNFSRTSRPIHHATTQEFFEKVYENGFVSEGKMKVFYSEKEDQFLPDRYIMGTCPRCGYDRANGDQCEKCTLVLDPLELINPKSATTGSAVVIKEANHLFLRLDKLSSQLEGWIQAQPHWRSQVTNLALGWIHEGLKERCITRDLKHGVPVPLVGFEKKVFYVWFDAPIGYISATKEVAPESWEKYWKNKDSKIYHFIGKDNIPFHTIFWPGMLLANKEFNLPYNVVGLQYLNYEGGKFSKSQKRGVFCEKLPGSGMDVDLLRAYLTVLIPETADSEWKWNEFQQRINSDVIGNFANFVNRSASFIATKLVGSVKRPDPKNITALDANFMKAIEEKVQKITELFEDVQIRQAFQECFALTTLGNKYFDETKPWEVLKKNPERAKEILYWCASLTRTLAIVFAPFMPKTTQKVWTMFGLDGSVRDGIWTTAHDCVFEPEFSVKKPEILFTKLTESFLEDFKKTVSDAPEVAELFKKHRATHK